MNDSKANNMVNKARDGVQGTAEAATSFAKDASRGLKGAVDTARDAASDVADAAAETFDAGKSRLGKAVETAKEAKDAVVAGAGSTLAAVRDAAVEKADEARTSLSDAGERLAETLQRASEGGDMGGLKSRVMSSVAQGLTAASDVLRDRSFTDIGSDIKTLARRHPGAFMVAAAVAGFAAARFLRASSHQSTAHYDGRNGQGPHV